MPIKVKSTFVKVRFERTTSKLIINALSPIVCNRSGKRLGVAQVWGIDDGMVKCLSPKVRALPIGEEIVRKVRLRNLGYDPCDRALID